MTDNKDILGDLIPVAATGQAASAASTGVFVPSEFDLKSLVPTVGADTIDVKQQLINPLTSLVPPPTAIPLDVKTPPRTDTKDLKDGKEVKAAVEEPIPKKEVKSKVERFPGRVTYKELVKLSIDEKHKYYQDQSLWYQRQKELSNERYKNNIKQYIQKFFAGPQKQEITDEEKKILLLRDKYGDYCVLRVKCGSDVILKVSPIEMATIPPFSFVTTEEPRIKIAPNVKPPFYLPVDGPDMVLVIDSQSAEALGDRRGFVSNNFPVSNYIESFFAPYKTAQLNIVFKAELKGLREAYLNTISSVATQIPIDESYDKDEGKIRYFKNGLNMLYNRIINEAKNNKELVDIMNKIITIQSQYKLVTPHMEESPFDYYASQILYSSMPDEYKDVGPALLYHPGLIEHAKVIMGNLVRLNVWKPEYFDYALPILEIESYRVASIPKSFADPPLIIPKDYFTIFDEDQIDSLDLFENRYLGKFLLDVFVGRVLDKLDFSKTCLTGSAIPVLFSRDINSISVFDPYSPIFIYGNDVELRGRTLDLANKTVLTPGSKIAEAVFEFGADVDLAILTDDDKEFDAIATKHFGVYSSQYPNLQLVKNIRTRGYSYQILSTNAENYIKGFRNVEIYKGTIAKILSHHVPMTRGWYDGKIHLDVTAIKVYKKAKQSGIRYFDNYFYFAGGKSTPLEILAKYLKRQFVYKMTDHKNFESSKLHRKFSAAIRETMQQKINEMRRIFNLNNIQRQNIYTLKNSPYFVPL